MKDFMKDYPPTRKMQVFFYVETLRRVQCFSTEGGWSGSGAKDYWWCPEAGISGHVGTHIFNTFLEAKHKRIENLTAEIHLRQRQRVQAEECVEEPA